MGIRTMSGLLTGMRSSQKRHVDVDDGDSVDDENEPLASFEDVVGLVTTLGVLAALGLSIMISLWMAMDRDQFDRVDMEICASRSAVFRELITDTLALNNF